MTKRTLTALLLLVAFGLCAGVAVAADAKATGKVLSIEENTLKVEIQGEKPSWVKKNAPVKFEAGIGKVVEVSAEGTTPIVVTVKTKKAPAVKAGDTFSFEKGRSMSGC